MISVLGYYLTGILLFMSGVYLICLRFKNFALVDIAWGLNFIIVVFLGLQGKTDLSAPQYLLSICVFLWGMRLSSFLFLRNFGKEEDFRYKGMREKWGAKANLNAYFRIFILQGVIAFIISMPIIFSFLKGPGTLGVFQVVGFILWGFGFVWESWADQVKSNFKKTPGNEDKPCDEGPWSYSQYANYFGEITLWWGLYFLSLPHNFFYISLISPVFITFLILKVSGIPYLEEKNKDRENYQDYRNKTNKFFPGRPKS